jgi:hypothetical protein
MDAFLPLSMPAGGRRSAALNATAASLEVIIPGKLPDRVAGIDDQTMISSPPRGTGGGPGRLDVTRSVVLDDELTLYDGGTRLTAVEFVSVLADGQCRP